jgi:hypothetical protein
MNAVTLRRLLWAGDQLVSEPLPTPENNRVIKSNSICVLLGYNAVYIGRGLANFSEDYTATIYKI